MQKLLAPEKVKSFKIIEIIEDHILKIGRFELEHHILQMAENVMNFRSLQELMLYQILPKTSWDDNYILVVVISIKNKFLLPDLGHLGFVGINIINVLIQKV